jgi:hypothetical protein
VHSSVDTRKCMQFNPFNPNAQFQMQQIQDRAISWPKSGRYGSRTSCATHNAMHAGSGSCVAHAVLTSSSLRLCVKECTYVGYHDRQQLCKIIQLTIRCYTRRLHLRRIPRCSCSWQDCCTGHGQQQRRRVAASKPRKAPCFTRSNRKLEPCSLQVPISSS